MVTNAPSSGSNVKNSPIMLILSGVLGLALITAAVLYATQIGKTNEANGKVNNLTLDLGTANGKISSLTSDLNTSKDKVTSLTADLTTANDKVNSLSADLGAANSKVTSLTADLNTANGRVTTLTADLATANTKVTSLTANVTKLTSDIATAVANVTKISNDLLAANANVAKLTADLATANSNVTKLTADLATANSNVTKLTADLAASKNDTATYAAALVLVGYPSHFSSVGELTDWLAADNTNNSSAYNGLRGVDKAYILQVKALQDGYLLPAQLQVTSNGTYYYGNVAVVGGSVYFVNVLTDAITLEGSLSGLSLYPISLPLH